MKLDDYVNETGRKYDGESGNRLYPISLGLKWVNSDGSSFRSSALTRLKKSNSIVTHAFVLTLG